MPAVPGTSGTVTLPISANLTTKLAAAADDGLNVNWVVQLFLPAPIGTKYYARRAVTIGGNVYAPKLAETPAVPKRADLSALRMDALNESVTLSLLNTPEDFDGDTDDSRIQTLMTQVSFASALVKVGFCELGTLSGGEADVKWDGLYRVDRIDRSTHRVQIYCVDATLHPGEKKIGDPVADRDWPAAPHESYGQVRGPIFGRVDSLNLVPVEVGLDANLAGEIDQEDRIIEIKGELGLWPAFGYVEIEDEIVYYPVIDKVNRILGSAATGCLRGWGFPNTAAAAHVGGSVVRELYSGKESTLSAIISASVTTFSVVNASGWPASGTVVVDVECIRYASISGNTLVGCTRGVPGPTIAKAHNAGAMVRTIPVGPTGAPRYRYLVGAGTVNAVSNVRVVDQGNTDKESAGIAYAGGATTLSQITTTGGKNVAVLDLPQRPRIEKYEGSVSRVPPEWVIQDNGAVGADGFTLPTGFARWKNGPLTSANIVAQLSYVLDPRASGKAAILKSSASDRIFNAIFNAHWDGGLNAPRRKYGRFKEARLKARYQYDRQTLEAATIEIWKDGVLQKSALLRPPPGTTGGGGAISGTQNLPKTRWGTQQVTRTLKLASTYTNMAIYQPYPSRGQWVDPRSQGNAAEGSPAQHGAVLDGDPRSFLSADWNYYSQSPQVVVSGYAGLGPLYLDTVELLPLADHKIVGVLINAVNPSGVGSGIITGWYGKITLFSGRGLTGSQIAMNLNFTGSAMAVTIPATMTWKQLQSARLEIYPYKAIGSTVYGVTVGDIQIDVAYLADIEGQRLDTTVDGSFFSTTATTVPSAVFEQTISIGSLARSWARAVDGRDPWDFFSKGAPEGAAGGLDIRVYLQTTAGAVQFAMADLELELEYEALTVSFDGTVVADVDGRTGTPVGGGATIVLQNPVDVLAYLVDQAEFYGLSAYRNSASFVAARTPVDAMKVARAVTEEVTVRDLVASLCGECRLLPLFDAAIYYVKYLSGEPTAAESVGTYGDQADAAKALVRDDFPITNKVEDLFNSIGMSYRRNYRTGDFRAVVEVDDLPSQATAVGKRRATPSLEWHQSARGYVSGLAQQKGVVQAIASYALSQSKVLWDYATIDLPAAGAEKLQRYDAVTLSRSRAGYYNALGRVVATQRSDNTKWQVVLRMGPATVAPYWQAEGSTYIMIADNGNKMQFYIEGIKVMEVTAAGNITVAAAYFAGVPDYSIVDPGLAGDVGTPDNISLRYDSIARSILFYRQRLAAGAHQGKMELVASLDFDGFLYIMAYRNNSDTLTTRRGMRLGSVSVATGAAGISDTGTGTTTGLVQMKLGNQVVAEWTDSEFRVRGSIQAGSL